MGATGASEGMRRSHPGLPSHGDHGCANPRESAHRDVRREGPERNAAENPVMCSDLLTLSQTILLIAQLLTLSPKVLR